MVRNSGVVAGNERVIKFVSLRLETAMSKGLFTGLLLLALTFALDPVYAKGPTTKITIKGPGITTPIEITDPKILADFRVWAGPGTSSNEEEGLIVNWSQQADAERPNGLRRYEVSFYAKRQEERLIYVVFYEYDSSIEQGYVYFPKYGEDWWRLNVGTVARGIEGHWFRASRTWERVARPLIAKAN